MTAAAEVVDDIEAEPISCHLPDPVRNKLMAMRERMLKIKTEAWYKAISKTIAAKGVAVFKAGFFSDNELSRIKPLFDIEVFGNEIRIKKVGLR